jgi:long-chain acyl-CoA synthetase
VSGIPGLLLERARAEPDAVALRSKRRGIWQATTWSGLLDRVCRVAAGLEDLGVRAGTAVGLVGENTPEWIVADLAVQALGARSVALPPQTPAPAVVRALAESGAGVVVCGDQEQVDLVVDAGGELAHIAIVVVNPTGTSHYDDPRVRALADVESVAPLDAAQLIERRAAGELTATLFSAGATGDPRPVDLTAGALVETARLAAAWLELGPRDRSLCVLSLAVPPARVLDLYAPIAGGAQIAVPESPATTAADLLEASPTVLFLSPRALELLRLGSERRARESSPMRRRIYRWGIGRLERRGRGGVAHLVVGRWVVAKLGLARARRVVVTGGPVATRDLRFFWSLGVPALATYGQAEVAGLALAQASLDDAGTAGRPLPGVSARLLDDGTLAVRAPATGGEWHATGDLAEEAPGGAIRVLGRPEEVVEAALCESAYIRRAVVAEGAALIEMDPDAMALWAADRLLAFSTYGSLVALPEVRELAAAEVAAVNERFGGGPAVARFTVLPRELDVARGELTALLTVRRGPVLDHFAAELGGPEAEPVPSAP